jgi:hypothetical protein
MTCLFGFCALAIDYGTSVATKNGLQRACVAGPLAGATALPNTALAQYQAQQTAGENTVTSPTITWPNGVKQIGVSASQQLSFFFGGAIGIPTGTVNASAVSARFPIAGVPHVVPLAITVDDFNSYKNGQNFAELLIDNNRQDFTNGTTVGLDLRLDSSGKSGAGFQQDLTWGYDGTTVYNEQIDSALDASLTSQGNKVDLAMDDRFTRAAGAPWYDTGNNYTFPNYPSGDPRVMVIMVADPNPVDNNNPMLNARFFAPVYVDRVTQSSGDTRLRFRILPTLNYSSEEPGLVIGDENTPDTGLAAVRLVG